MKIRDDIKEILLKPKYFGLLISRIGKPHTTIKRWIDTDYKDLRLPENTAILMEITGLTQSQIFEPETENAK